MKITSILSYSLLATFGLATEQTSTPGLVARTDIPRRSVMKCGKYFPDSFYSDKFELAPIKRTVSIVARNYVEKQGEVSVTVYANQSAMWESSCRYDCGPDWNRHDFQQLLGPPLLDAPLEINAGNWCEPSSWRDGSWAFDNFWIRYKDDWRNAPTNCHIWASAEKLVETQWFRNGHIQCNMTVEVPAIAF